LRSRRGTRLQAVEKGIIVPLCRRTSSRRRLDPRKESSAFPDRRRRRSGREGRRGQRPPQGAKGDEEPQKRAPVMRPSRMPGRSSDREDDTSQIRGGAGKEYPTTRATACRAAGDSCEPGEVALSSCRALIDASHVKDSSRGCPDDSDGQPRVRSAAVSATSLMYHHRLTAAFRRGPVPSARQAVRALSRCTRHSAKRLVRLTLRLDSRTTIGVTPTTSSRPFREGTW